MKFRNIFIISVIIIGIIVGIGGSYYNKKDASKGDDIPQKYKQGAGDWMIYPGNRIWCLPIMLSGGGLGIWRLAVVYR